MRMERFDYDLPPERIAQVPPERRDASRLLILDRGSGAREDATFPDLLDRLRPNDLLVVNETRVFPARLFARRDSGARIELLLVRPLDGSDPGTAAGRVWEALARPGRRARAGERLALESRGGDPAPDAAARLVEARADGIRRLELEVPGDPWAWIEAHGHVPLPPYIERPDADLDRARYQTVYARARGAVAAPTAGLHFTAELFERLAAAGVRRAVLTLHVGPGTFRPVTAERAEDHAVDPEWFEVTAATAAALHRTRQVGGRVVAVGTTVVRALESAGREWGDEPRPVSGWTDLTIRPGFTFRVVDALVTNFHLPRSSLLLLVGAFAGVEPLLAAYRHAVRAGYRFYSYGDAMLIIGT